MYQIFKSIGGKPIQIIGVVIAIILVVVMISMGLSQLGSLLGFNTKENLIIKNERTTFELAKAVEILENNQLESKVLKEIDVITKDKVIQDNIVTNQLRDNESKLLEQIRNTLVEEPILVEKIVEVEKEVYISSKPTIVYAPKKLNNKQKLALSILKDRANNLKGNKR